MAALALVAITVGLVVSGSHGTAEPPADADANAPTEVAEATLPPAAPVTHAASPRTPTEPAGPSAPAGPAQPPTLPGLTPLSPMPPPPPSDYVPVPSPRPEALPQETFVQRREVGVQMLDDSLARLEAERLEQERAGDTEDARFTQVRIDRMRALREQRAEELEAARRGELTPDIAAGELGETTPLEAPE